MVVGTTASPLDTPCDNELAERFGVTAVQAQRRPT